VATLGEPVDPFRQTVPPGSAPPVPSEYTDRSDEQGRIARDEAERERARDDRHARHPDDTTAPPSQPNGGGTGDAAYNTFFTAGTRKKVVE
jgi:hypothetical protein